MYTYKDIANVLTSILSFLGVLVTGAKKLISIEVLMYTGGLHATYWQLVVGWDGGDITFQKICGLI